jgi:hypothetical protein
MSPDPNHLEKSPPPRGEELFSTDDLARQTAGTHKHFID